MNLTPFLVHGGGWYHSSRLTSGDDSLIGALGTCRHQRQQLTRMSGRVGARPAQVRRQKRPVCVQVHAVLLGFGHLQGAIIMGSVQVLSEEKVRYMGSFQYTVLARPHYLYPMGGPSCGGKREEVSPDSPVHCNHCQEVTHRFRLYSPKIQ